MVGVTHTRETIPQKGSWSGTFNTVKDPENYMETVRNYIKVYPQANQPKKTLRKIPAAGLACLNILPSLTSIPGVSRCVKTASINDQISRSQE